MKITCCDLCRKEITEFEKGHKISLNVTPTSGLFGLPIYTAGDVKDLCESCFDTVKELISDESKI